jgi:hypothetical protein
MMAPDSLACSGVLLEASGPNFWCEPRSARQQVPPGLLEPQQAGSHEHGGGEPSSCQFGNCNGNCPRVRVVERDREPKSAIPRRQHLLEWRNSAQGLESVQLRAKRAQGQVQRLIASRWCLIRDDVVVGEDE